MVPSYGSREETEGSDRGAGPKNGDSGGGESAKRAALGSVSLSKCGTKDGVECAHETEKESLDGLIVDENLFWQEREEKSVRTRIHGLSSRPTLMKRNRPSCRLSEAFVQMSWFQGHLEKPNKRMSDSHLIDRIFLVRACVKQTQRTDLWILPTSAQIYTERKKKRKRKTMT